METKTQHSDTTRRVDIDEDELTSFSLPQSHMRIMLERAIMVYVILFIGLAVFMAALGVNPLINQGLMPKALLIFVGMALGIAMANSLIDFANEQGRNWMIAMQGFIRAVVVKKLDQ